MARTRSASAHRKVLDAAIALVAERGIEGTSMDAIAERSGVSKATIYKHWADKEGLLLEVMSDISGLRSRPKFDSGDTREDMIAVLSHRADEGCASWSERIMPHLVAYSARNPSFGNAWRRMVMDPPRRELAYLLSLGIERGELAPDLDVDVALPLLLGPMLYAHIFLQRAERNERVLAEGVVDAFWRAFGL